MDHYLPRLSPEALRWTRLGAALLAAALVLWLVFALRGVLSPLAIGLAIAYVLNPLVNWLEQQRVRRIVSASVGLVVTLGVVGVLILLGTLQIIEFSQRLPEYVRAFTAWAGSIPNLLPADGTPGAASRPLAALGALAQNHGLAIAEWLAANVPELLGKVGYWLTAGVLIPAYAFFFILHFNEMIENIRRHLPAASRETIETVVSTIDRSIADFFRGRLLIAVLIGVLSAIGWYIVGTPYSLVLGALMIPLQLLPGTGVLILPPLLILTYVEAPGGAWFWPVVAGFAVYMIVQGIESFVLSPYIYAQSSGLHPVTTVVALLVGLELAGVLGMLLSIPLASTIKSLGRRYVMPEVRRLADLPPPQPPPASAPGTE